MQGTEAEKIAGKGPDERSRQHEGDTRKYPFQRRVMPAEGGHDALNERLTNISPTIAMMSEMKVDARTSLMGMPRLRTTT